MKSKSLKLVRIQVKKTNKQKTLFVKAMINTRSNKKINMEI